MQELLAGHVTHSSAFKWKNKHTEAAVTVLYFSSTETHWLQQHNEEEKLWTMHVIDTLMNLLKTKMHKKL